jgi:hypothetical protein
MELAQPAGIKLCLVGIKVRGVLMVSVPAPTINLTFETTLAASKFFLATWLCANQYGTILVEPNVPLACFSFNPKVMVMISQTSGIALASQPDCSTPVVLFDIL